MSNNAVLSALRRMGFDKDEMTGHGFRAMARTVLDEVLHFRPDYIEHQLAHAVRDPNGRAYNRTVAPSRAPQDDGGMGGLSGPVTRQHRQRRADHAQSIRRQPVTSGGRGA